MSDMIKIGREAINQNKVASFVTVITLATPIILALLGINPVNPILENSSAFEREVSHIEHMMESQNLILLKLLKANMISDEEFADAIHSIDHKKDSQ